MTIKDLQKDIAEIGEYVKTQLAKNFYNPENTANDSPFSALPSPNDYAVYLKNLSKNLGPDGTKNFIEKQVFLKSLNPTFGAGKLYNPASVYGPPPYAGGIFTDFAEAPLASMNPSSQIAVRQDRIKSLSNGQYNNVQKQNATSVNVEVATFRYDDGKTVGDKRKDLNLFSEENKATDFEYFENENFQDTGLDGRITVTKNGVSYDIPDIERRFERKNGVIFKDGIEKGGLFFKPKKSTMQQMSSERKARELRFQDQDTFFNQQDFEKGFVETNLDQEIYIPFSFQDLRKPERLIYFRAFITNFKEDFSPNWNTSEFFGRVDEVALYKNTSRKLNVSFKVMPLSPPGFTAAWRKINNLTKMFYPQYKNGSMFASPICRLKIGDVIAVQSGEGLPGYISNVSFDYSNAIWEVQKFTGPSEQIELGEAPMKIEVSFTFNVLHEKNPGLDSNYNFDFSIFRRIGSLSDDINAINGVSATTGSLDFGSDPDALTNTPEEA
jgi:hypothetical protein